MMILHGVLLPGMSVRCASAVALCILLDNLAKVHCLSLLLDFIQYLCQNVAPVIIELLQGCSMYCHTPM